MEQFKRMKVVQDYPGKSGSLARLLKCPRAPIIMTTFQPATPHSDLIARLACSKCGTGMDLFGIEDDRQGYELHSFECPDCHHIGTAVAKIH